MSDSARREPVASAITAVSAGETPTAPFLLPLFVLTILSPGNFFLGGTQLSLTRVMLLVLVIPLTIQLLRGAAGRIRAVDILMFLFSLWVVIAILYHEGFARLPFAAVTVIEVLGGYLVGRVLVRNATDYRLLLRWILIALLVLLPFAIIEFLTNQNILQKIFGSVFHTYGKTPGHTWRNGFARVISVFEHPILYGLFCAIAIAPLFYRYRDNLTQAACAAGLALGMTYMSLSSAPVIAAGIAVMLIGWDLVTKGRWKPLITLFLFMYVLLSVASNRGPIILLIENLTFNAHTAWTRVATWEFGSQEVLDNPLWGIGLVSAWNRPSWLTRSVDNFWLVIAMRYGFPGIILLGVALVAGMWAVSRARFLDRTAAQYRTGYVIALVGLYFTLATVHIWGDTSSFLMCFIGAGLWLASASDARQTGAETTVSNLRPVRTDGPRPVVASVSPPPSSPQHGLPTSRFAPRHNRKRPNPSS